MTSDIEAHYAGSGIAERILAAVRASLPAGAAVTVDALAPADHFHGRGLAATREMVALLEPAAGERILDIGCGIGGPARWVAAKHGAIVTGIDLTRDFCAAAVALTAAAGLADRVTIINASATALPFGDATFDRAYSQNVIMNVADKAAFYREARRVLKRGGRLVLSNVVRGDGPEPVYPTPWATTADASFLSTIEETRSEIGAAGLDIKSLRETTAQVLAGHQAAMRNLAQHGVPAIGTHLILGPRLTEMQRNGARNWEEGRLRAIEIVAEGA